MFAGLVEVRVVCSARTLGKDRSMMMDGRSAEVIWEGLAVVRERPCLVGIEKRAFQVQ